MGPHVDPDQRLFVEWMAHLVRARLHLVDAYATAVAEGPVTAGQRRDLVAIRSVIRQILGTLDEVLAAGPGPIRPPP